MHRLYGIKWKSHFEWRIGEHMEVFNIYLILYPCICYDRVMKGHKNTLVRIGCSQPGNQTQALQKTSEKFWSHGHQIVARTEPTDYTQRLSWNCYIFNITNNSPLSPHLLSDLQTVISVCGTSSTYLKKLYLQNMVSCCRYYFIVVINGNKGNLLILFLPASGRITHDRGSNQMKGRPWSSRFGSGWEANNLLICKG
jgi:hypothetical protein